MREGFFMDCPIEITVYEKDRTAGTAKITQEGLYYRISCRLKIKPSRIERLYLISGFHSLPIGVLMPTEDGLLLNQKISVQSWPLDTVDAALCGYAPESCWLPWRGELEGTQLQGWIKEEQTGYLLAVDVSETPFPLIESLADAEPITLSEIECMCLRIDRTGKILKAVFQNIPDEIDLPEEEESDE